MDTRTTVTPKQYDIARLNRNFKLMLAEGLDFFSKRSMRHMNNTLRIINECRRFRSMNILVENVEESATSVVKLQDILRKDFQRFVGFNQTSLKFFSILKKSTPSQLILNDVTVNEFLSNIFLLKLYMHIDVILVSMIFALTENALQEIEETELNGIANAYQFKHLSMK